MITNIKLLNFQKHKELDIDFDQVTTIVGPSDAGKSAILRALIWNATNSTSGKAFLREGADAVGVQVTIDDTKIVRGVRKTSNVYKVDGEVCKAFGRGVPDEVQEVWSLSPACIQRQLDGPFLLGMSGGDAAQYLNSVAGIDVLDRAVKKLSTKEKSEVKQADGLVEQEKLLEEGTEAVKIDSDRLAKLKALRSQVSDLEALGRDIEALETILDSIPQPVEPLPENLGDLVAEAEVLESQIEILKDLAVKATFAQNKLKREQESVKLYEEKLEGIEVCPSCQRPL